MIAIDMKLPKECDSCPCSYWIQTGEHAGKLMCNVKEYMQTPVSDCLVNGLSKPADCPMHEAIMPAFCPACGKSLI